MRLNASTRRFASCLFGVSSLLAAAGAAAWTEMPVAVDPLVRMPGSQPANGVSVEAPGRCLNCHAGYDATVEPGSRWRGSMMSHAARDPIFWASVVVAMQDSIWATGRPNAADLCLRCHSPSGWLGGRSDPPNGAALAADDFDGVHCDVCHRMVDPFFEDTYAGVREGADWPGYWDEAGSDPTNSQLAADATILLDRSEAFLLEYFNGNPLYDTGSGRPFELAWDENGGGQYLVATDAAKRAPFADAVGRHAQQYSRYHKSRFFCGTCHDVSNSVLANIGFDGTPPGDGNTRLVTETSPAYSYYHVERTFSEFRLSAYGTGAGADGIGPYDPSVYTTSKPGNQIASCQDCHMPNAVGAGCDKKDAPIRPIESTDHPKSGQPVHHMVGGNAFVPLLLASTVPGSPNYDPVNEGLLSLRAAELTMDLTAGVPLDHALLRDAANRALLNLQRAAAIENLTYDGPTGAIDLRIQNQTGHKLISGYPEGRRMWVNVRAYQGGSLVWELNPYSHAADTLKGLPYSTSSPPLDVGETYDDSLVYEVVSRSGLTGEDHTFHMALSTERYKDNRIPPLGFRIGEAPTRMAEPVSAGSPDPNYFTPAEYAGGYDEIQINGPVNADGIVVSVYYQTTSREFIEFLRDEIDGVAGTLPEPTPQGEATAYVAQSDPYFAQLADWGQTIWQLWDHNRDVPGAAPVLMVEASVGTTGTFCSQAGSDGQLCNDGDLCTSGDVCVSGSCQGTPVTCSALDDCHDVGICDGATGLCTNPPMPDTTPCDDGDLCTLGDECTGGVCGGTDTTCTALDQCHEVGICDPATGLCPDPLLPDDTPCDDGSACTATDVCTAGICGGTTIDCDDGDPCTDDSCDSAVGCMHGDNMAPCDDGDACTVNDVCSAGACTLGAAADCDDGNECTDDSCDSVTGCVNANNTAACPGGTCQGGVCVPSGTGGSAGVAGTGGGAGSAGTGGTAGTGGSAGATAGTGGTAGATAGTGGSAGATAGTGGVAGSSGTAGTPGAGAGGGAGAAGATDPGTGGSGGAADAGSGGVITAGSSGTTSGGSGGSAGTGGFGGSSASGNAGGSATSGAAGANLTPTPGQQAEDEGGCGCRTAGGSGRSPAALLGLLLLGASLVRRRYGQRAERGA